MDDVSLKPCPFCGEKTHIEVRRTYSPDTGEEEDACITCAGCLSTFRYEEAVNAEEVVEHWNKRAVHLGRWKEVEGDYISPGGTPYFVCAQCGGGEHLYGAEYPKRALVCPKCGSVNLYPWEKVRWLEDEQ